MSSWDLVAQRYGTDKASTHHGYMNIYEDLLKNRDVKCLFEIGVSHGKSHAMWAELFPEATIVGVDIFPECRLHQRKRLAVYIADATDPAHMAAVAALHPPFDVIIDDCAHTPDQVGISFEELYPRMAVGGIYIIEDMDGADPWVQNFVKHWGARVIPCNDRVGYLAQPCLIVKEKH